jgi:type IV pilus biogenesis protein CpaD/CtpE
MNMHTTTKLLAALALLGLAGCSASDDDAPAPGPDQAETPF